MAMDAKQDFLRMAEQNLADTVTAAEMPRILCTLASLMDGYDMTKLIVQTDENDDCLKCYLDTMRVRCLSEKTIARYNYIIARMLKAVNLPTRRVTVYHLRAYLSAEKERGISDRTLEGYREIFSAYFNWLQRESLIDKNPTANLDAVKFAKKEKKVCSEIDIELLNQACTEMRDRAIIAFLVSTGCRVSEMCGLNREDVDLSKLECVVHGKGGKDRTVYLSEVAGMLIGRYLMQRRDDHPALFYSRAKTRLSPNGVRVMLKRIADRAGVEHIHPHKFRRTLATTLAHHGMPVQEIASVLGHEKIDTTMQYVVLDKENTKNAYRRYA